MRLPQQKETDKAAGLKSNHDAACKICGTEGPGRSLIMKRHLVDCNIATPYSHLHALKDQAKHFVSEVYTETDIDFHHPAPTGVATSSALL